MVRLEELTKGTQVFNAAGHRRKLVIFTEHRDTLNYLTDRIRTLLGRTEAVVTIHGGMGREERRKAQKGFRLDVSVQVLIATITIYRNYGSEAFNQYNFLWLGFGSIPVLQK
jgi:superfamily II DNA/RNA helicase